MTEKALAVRSEVSHGLSLSQLASAMAKSGYWRDIRSAAQAAVKIIAGQEMGIPAVAAMNHIYIVNGRACADSQIMAAKIRESEEYDFRIDRLDNDGCQITFLRRRNGTWEELQPPSVFTREDAERADLVKKQTYQQYPRNLFFARALSNGARWFCSHLFLSASWTPEEMGAEVDEQGAPISVQVVAPELDEGDGGPVNPEDPESIRAAQAKALWAHIWKKVTNETKYEGKQIDLLEKMGYSRLGELLDAAEEHGDEGIVALAVATASAMVGQAEKEATPEGWLEKLKAEIEDVSDADAKPPTKPMVGYAAGLLHQCWPDLPSDSQEFLRKRFMSLVNGKDSFKEWNYYEVKILLDSLVDPETEKIREGAVGFIRTLVGALKPKANQEEEALFEEDDDGIPW